jgi:2-keto-4-pentenoate hydratase/2-oxohepta-3-ene-1,7-dioic acid hydratase in catechol pathway
LRLRGNDDLRQNSNTSNMLYCSEFITLEPGDVIFTGSPAGSAMSEDQFLKGGDRVRAQIEGIGTLNIELIDERVGRTHAGTADSPALESPSR